MKVLTSQRGQQNKKSINIFTQKLFLFELGYVEDLKQIATSGDAQVLLFFVEEAIYTEYRIVVFCDGSTLGIRLGANTQKTSKEIVYNQLLSHL